jgi:hypothetical protein
MAIVLPQGKQQYFDDNGDPLVGGKLYTYAPGPGVTTPKATHQDAGATVLNANPIILDARGEALVFWTGGYNVRLEDSVGNLIWTVEGLADAAADLATELADVVSASQGAGMIGFNPSLNYVARTLGAARNNDGVQVMDLITSQVERAAVKAGTSTTDHTALFVTAFLLSRHVRVAAGVWNITQVELPAYSMLEGAGPYTTKVRVTIAGVGTNRGLYRREATEAESGIVLKNFSMEAYNFGVLGRHSYGLNLGNIAHANVENVHAEGFERGFYLEDALINTFTRCRANACKWGAYIDGTEPFASGPGANKNHWIDFKGTNCGSNAAGGAAILLTGTSCYQNIFDNADLEYNFVAVSCDGSADAPHLFNGPTFEGDADDVDRRNLIRSAAGTKMVFEYPVFGNVGSGQVAWYIDPSFNLGTIEIVGGFSNSQDTRVLPPIMGRYELVGSNGHDVASTSIYTAINNEKQYIPQFQTGGLVSGPALSAYIYGEASGDGSTLRNTFDFDPNVAANWTSGTATAGQADPIGGTGANALTSNVRIQRSVGASTGKIVAQVFVQVTTGTPGEFQLAYYNNGTERSRRIFSFSGTTGWLLCWVSFDLTGAVGTSTQHDLRIEECTNKITIWWPQIIQGTDKPQPILPTDGAGKTGAGSGVTPSWAYPLRKVGESSYEEPQIVKRVSYNGNAAATATFPPLVDSDSPALGRVFELVVRENFTTNYVVTVYHVSLSYAGTAATADCIKQVSQALYGGGGASRVAATVSATTAAADKSIVLTNSNTATVLATVREIT